MFGAKSVKLFLCISFFFIFFIPYGYAATLVVVKDRVNVRQEPDLESPILVRLNSGQRLEEIQKIGRWHEVQPQGITQIKGWIFGSLVMPLEEYEEQESKGGGLSVASFGQVVLSEAELNSFLSLLDAPTRRKAALDLDFLKNMVREEVVRKKIIQEAVASGFDKLPRIVRFMERARTQALADHFLSEQAQAADDFPSDQEIKRLYELNKEKYTDPQRVHVSQIFIHVPADLGEEQRETLRVKAQKVSDLARFDGSDFAALASDYSEHMATAQAGGDLGWVEEGAMAAGMRQILAGMEINSVSTPYRSGQGWHVFKLMNREDAFVRPLEDVSTEIREELRRRKMIENRDLYLRNIIEKDEVFLDEGVIPKMR